MTIAITGGGTGGHLAIANALKEELNERGLKPIYIGSQNGQDKSWFQNDDGFGEKYFLNSSGVVNKQNFKKLSVLKDIILSSFKCKKIFKKHNIQAVFCVGGYSAAPASLASILSNIPLYIHEQNAVIGTLNKILKPFAKEFFSSYDTSSKVQEYPVSNEFFKHRKIRKKLNTIIFLGGSQGATFINNMCMKIAPKLIENNIQIIHQTGKNDYEKVQSFYQKNNLNVDCFEFTNNIISKLQLSDFAISRAGASTLWELSASAIPSLFIPYPYAAKNHQYFNAKMLADKNIALVKTQEEINEDILLEIIKNINIHEISEKLFQTITKNGIEDIANIILKSNN